MGGPFGVGVGGDEGDRVGVSGAPPGRAQALTTCWPGRCRAWFTTPRGGGSTTRC